LAAGELPEIAGYKLSAALASGLEAASLQTPRRPSQAVWLEVSTLENASPSPVLATAAQRWQTANSPVKLMQVQGPAFWQTSEIEDAPNLLEATLNAIRPNQTVEVTA
jgi:hypothetical protein